MPSPEDLLAPLLELHSLINSHRPFSEVLAESVEMVERLLHSDACSIYLLDTDKNRLVLEASRGLAPESVGKVALPLGKGLVGRSFATLTPVASADVFQDPDFEYLPETHEEKFHSLLAVPILYQNQPLGVLTIQQAGHMVYETYHIHFLQLLANQLGPLINRARFQTELDKTLHHLEPHLKSAVLASDMFKGRPAAPGIAWGRARILRPYTLDSASQILIAEDENSQIALFQQAATDLIGDIQATKARAEHHVNASELAIFDVYDLLLSKDVFQETVIEKIRTGLPLPQAIKATIDDIAEPLLMSDDLYLRERAFDIEDLGAQLLSRLSKRPEHAREAAVAEPHILVCHRITAFDLVNLYNPDMRGIVSEEGGTTGHAAMLAQALNIPAVMGIKGLVRRLGEDDYVLLDGTSGVVITNPDTPTQKLYKEKKKQIKNSLAQLGTTAVHTRITEPYPIEIAANIGSLAQVNLVRAAGADAIGLYRTEFPFLIRRRIPTEEEQLEIYRTALKEVKGLSITFRILDIGGDKPLMSLLPHPEENPALGWRALRLALARPEIFEMQLRALLRASTTGPMKLLFPMVSSLDDIISIKTHLEKAKQDLTKRGEPYADTIPLGIMIELPAAVSLADVLLEAVDFCSIGTNDLIQYTLAVDRNNPEVAQFYDPFHPSVLRAIAHVAEVARRLGKKVGICGEMAADPLFLPFFLAIGIDNLSISPTRVSELKSILLKRQYTPMVTEAVLGCRSSREIKDLLNRHRLL